MRRIAEIPESVESLGVAGNSMPFGPIPSSLSSHYSVPELGRHRSDYPLSTAVYMRVRVRAGGNSGQKFRNSVGIPRSF